MNTPKRNDYMTKDELVELKVELNQFIETMNDYKDLDFDSDDWRVIKDSLRFNLQSMLWEVDRY